MIQVSSKHLSGGALLHITIG